MIEQGPDYIRIYTDIILMNYPQKLEICTPILRKKKLTALEVIELNELIFGLEEIETAKFNQRHKSYDESTIIKLLNFQKNNGYNNTQMADQFKMSRNTLAKWKKIFHP